MTLRMWDIARASAGGLLGAFFMRSALGYWHSRTKDAPEHGAFGLDREADVNSIQLLAGRLFKRPINDDEAYRLATQFHYAYGALGAAAYLTAAARYPSVRANFGMPFGFFLWLLGDELPIAALGISDPFNKSIYSHATALAAHLLYAACVELTCRIRLGSEHVREPMRVSA